MSFSEYEVEKIHENYQDKLYKKDMEIAELKGGFYENKFRKTCSYCGTDKGVISICTKHCQIKPD